MSFASEVRKELARSATENENYIRSEIAAALLSLNAVSFRGKNRFSVSFTVDSASIVRYFFSQIKKQYGIICSIHTTRSTQLNHRLRYRLIVPDDDCYSLLYRLDMLDKNSLFGFRTEPNRAVLAGEGCCEAFLRGAFMVCGSITNPEKSYHMEFAPVSEAVAANIMKILRNFEFDVKMTCRKSQYVVYLKESERIVDLLTRIGAHKATLEMENVRVQKQVLNLVNRQMNCDANNIKRTMDTSEAQIRDIEYIEDQIGLDKLPKSLRDMAIVRKNNPATSLAGLGDMLEPPIGKSGVNNRLRRLTAIAEQLRRGDTVEL